MGDSSSPQNAIPQPEAIEDDLPKIYPPHLLLNLDHPELEIHGSVSMMELELTASTRVDVVDVVRVKNNNGSDIKVIGNVYTDLDHAGLVGYLEVWHLLL